MKIFENPDKKVVKDIRKQLKENDGYCPCYLIHDKEHKCVCVKILESKLNLDIVIEVSTGGCG